MIQGLLSYSAGAVAAFSFGFLYFLAAIPAGVAAGAPLLLATLTAWMGYSSGALLVIVAGTPLRDWLVKRLKIPVQRDPSKLVWRVWEKWGLAGLGLLAPVTIGPQVGGILALAVGERPGRVLLALSLGVIPWCLLFAAFVACGIKIAR